MKNALLPIPASVVAVERQTADTYTCRLRLGNGAKFSFAPGQFNLVGCAGFGEAAISVSSGPGEGDTFEHTFRAVGRVTNELKRRAPKDQVFVRGPFGRGWPLAEARGRDVIIVAGGIGLCPLRSVVLTILGNRAEYGKVAILYGARTPRDVVFRSDLERWAGEGSMQVLTTVDEVPPGTQWPGQMGVVTTLYEHIDLDVQGAVACICGPEIMMRFALVGLLQRGISSGRAFVSLERRMRCGIAQCGHCQIGPKYVCKDGPVFSFRELREIGDTLL